VRLPTYPFETKLAPRYCSGVTRDGWRWTGVFNSFLRVDGLLKTRRGTGTVRFIDICRCIAFAESAPEVSFISPCDCIGFHGIHLWIAKTDLTPVPADAVGGEKKS
jgi:hypothetical protein